MVVICGQHSWAVAAVKRMNLSHVIGNAQTLILTESAVGQVFIETVIMISQIVQDHTVESVKCFFTKWTVQNLHDVFYLTFRNKMLTFQELIADWKNNSWPNILHFYKNKIWLFKDKLHYFFTVWVTRNYENEKKNTFWIRVTSYLHTPLYQIFNFQKWITVFFSYSMGYSKL